MASDPRDGGIDDWFGLHNALDPASRSGDASSCGASNKREFVARCALSRLLMFLGH